MVKQVEPVYLATQCGYMSSKKPEWWRILTLHGIEPVSEITEPGDDITVWLAIDSRM
jgi:hypothetical protein